MNAFATLCANAVTSTFFLRWMTPILVPSCCKSWKRLSRKPTPFDGIARTVVGNLKVMARMGVILEDVVRRQYPEFPLQNGVRSWEEYLPPLSETLLQLAERYDTADAAMAAAP